MTQGKYLKPKIAAIQSWFSFRNTLTAAEVLVEKLNTEYYSWKQQMEGLNADLQKIDKKSFLISFSITHISHYTYDQRK